MTESEKTTVWIYITYHKKISHRAVDNRTTIEEEIDKILEKEFKEE